MSMCAQSPSHERRDGAVRGWARGLQRGCGAPLARRAPWFRHLVRGRHDPAFRRVPCLWAVFRHRVSPLRIPNSTLEGASLGSTTARSPPHRFQHRSHRCRQISLGCGRPELSHGSRGIHACFPAWEKGLARASGPKRPALAPNSVTAPREGKQQQRFVIPDGMHILITSGFVRWVPTRYPGPCGALPYI